jgi:cytochrome c-type biogenesis protein CcmF
VVTNKSSDPTFARWSFWATVVNVVGASVLLMYYILNHRFEYSYVWGYSSKELPLHLLVTTFWAGQEGSFLFWALCAVLIGIVLLAFTRRNKMEFEVMAVYMLTVSALLMLLIAKSPFTFLWQTYPDQLTPGNVPSDGRGLNPLLQNVWMIAHPPTLFIGFATLAVPFAFAIAALWRKRYTDWVAPALPWVGFGALSLGLGLMLGGYWAYGVLGWGGWWGWDPVENSSLIPWITVVILLHTLLVQKKTGKLARTNFVLAIVSFLLVVYSTFLTRSGILGESSVHSFVDPGNLVYSLLIAWIAVMTGIGTMMLIRRWNELRKLAVPTGIWTRESFLSFGAIAMALSALMIFIGTSWPIVSNVAVEPSFYNKTNLPITIILSLLLGFSLFTRWGDERRTELIKRSLIPLGLALLATVILYAFGVTDWQMLVFAFSSLFVFATSVRLLVVLAKENTRQVGGPLAHIGLAVLFLGIIGSGRYGEKVSTALPLNQPTVVLGYELTYKGVRPQQDGKLGYLVDVRQGDVQFQLEPVMFTSNYTNSLMRNPDYASSWTRDFYIEPVAVENNELREHNHHLFELKKGEAQMIGEYRVTFEKFDMGNHGLEGMVSGGGFAIGAVLTVEKGKKKEQVVATTVYRENQNPDPKEVKLKDGTIGFQMVGMQVGSAGNPSVIHVLATGLPSSASVSRKVETLIVEASVKPFIHCVWLGAVLVLLGFTLSVMRRLQEVKAKENGARRPAEKKPVEPSARVEPVHTPAAVAEASLE